MCPSLLYSCQKLFCPPFIFLNYCIVFLASIIPIQLAHPLSCVNPASCTISHKNSALNSNGLFFLWNLSQHTIFCASVCVCVCVCIYLFVSVSLCIHCHSLLLVSAAGLSRDSRPSPYGKSSELIVIHLWVGPRPLTTRSQPLDLHPVPTHC